MTKAETKRRWKEMAQEVIGSGEVERVQAWLGIAGEMVSAAKLEGDPARRDHWLSVSEGIQEALDDDADRD